jgi:hypothetical protein
MLSWEFAWLLIESHLINQLTNVSTWPQHSVSQNQLWNCSMERLVALLHNCQFVWFQAKQFCGSVYRVFWFADEGFDGQASKCTPLSPKIYSARTYSDCSRIFFNKKLVLKTIRYCPVKHTHCPVKHTHCQVTHFHFSVKHIQVSFKYDYVRVIINIFVMLGWMVILDWNM